MVNTLGKRELRTVRLAYGLGDFYGGASVGVINLLFLFFLTNIAGISPLQAGIVVFIGRAVDAVTDPLMGIISDRTRTKAGRRVPYFFWGVVPVMASFVLLWIVPVWSGWSLIVYYAAAYSFFSVAFTMVMVPYAALAPELSSDAGQRASIVGARMACSIIGGLVSAVLPVTLINVLGGEVKTGYLWMSMLFGLAFGLIWLLMFFVMRGREICPAESRPLKLSASVNQVFCNRPFRILIAVYLLAFIPNDITAANFKYFLNYYLLREGDFSLVVGLTMVSAVLSLPVYLMLIKKWGKPKTMLWGCLFRSACLASFFTLGPDSPLWLILFLSFLHGLGMGSSYAVPWALLPEVTDYDEAISGTRNEGIYSGVMTFIRKLSSSIAILAIGAILQAARYSGEAAVQPPYALTAIRLTTILLPLALSLLAAFSVARFPIGPHNIGKLRSLVDTRRNGSFGALTEAEREELVREIKL
jgi:oligogalacturonide transporter